MSVEMHNLTRSETAFSSSLTRLNGSISDLGYLLLVVDGCSCCSSSKAPLSCGLVWVEKQDCKRR